MAAAPLSHVLTRFACFAFVGRAQKELEGFGIRLNQTPPNIVFKQKDKGGINITTQVQLTHLDKKTITGILKEYRIVSADVTLRCDATDEQLIDVIEGNRLYIPCIYVLNKIDQISVQELDILTRVPHCVPISSHHEWNIDELLDKAWEYLDLVRIYTKPRGQLPDYESPVVLKRGLHSVEDFCNAIHKSLAKDFK